MLAAALSIAFLPWHVKMLSSLDDRLVYQGAYYRDLREVGRAPAVRAALAAVRPDRDGRPPPDPAPALVARAATRAPSPRSPTARPSRGSQLLLLPRRTRQMRRFYRENFPTTKRPAGSRLLYRNASWRVFAAPGCSTR